MVLRWKVFRCIPFSWQTKLSGASFYKLRTKQKWFLESRLKGVTPSVWAEPWERGLTTTPCSERPATVNSNENLRKAIQPALKIVSKLPGSSQTGSTSDMNHLGKFWHEKGCGLSISIIHRLLRCVSRFSGKPLWIAQISIFTRFSLLWPLFSKA